MSDGSGSTSWTYDGRGRMTQESKAITGSGTFVTQWGYNSADLPTWVKYPANNSSGVGEQVNYTYLPQMLLDTVSGTSPTTYQYTGQRLETSLGLLFYNARWYDPALGRITPMETAATRMR
jgi:RHS repeat-associated protein